MTSAGARYLDRPNVSPPADGHDGFAALLHAEWTKFRTVRGWVVGMIGAALALVLLGALTGAASRSTYSSGPGAEEVIGHPYVPIGPDGEAVTDNFQFVHQQLTGDGSITARVAQLTGGRLASGPNGPAGPPPADEQLPTGDATPWSKAGLIMKADAAQGSAYVAIMVTGDHGVRMQHNFTGDIAGEADVPYPQWLRLTRSGGTVTGSVSSDGAAWTTVGVVETSLPATVLAGMFATAPADETVTQQFGGGGTVTGGPTIATGTFDSLALQGNWTGPWGGETIGAGSDETRLAGVVGFDEAAGTFSVTGAGDIAPGAAGAGTPIERVLVGGFAALTIAAVLAVLFITTEYRRGMVRTSFTASPRRGRVLAAKAIVIGGVTFVTGLIAGAITVPLAERLLVDNGNFVYPISLVTESRLIAGTALVMALAAVLALAIGTIVRRSAIAVAVVIVLVVLPYILASAAVLPAGPSDWLLRVTPAAAFAVQQSLNAYPQVDGAYIPAFGFYPLGPLPGLLVLCGYTAAALCLAWLLLRRRDV
jgi:ABC-type transport system involved in multi-copper enzyme maturation permease subunit